MREALRTKDELQFERALISPVTVYTASWCTAIFASATSFSSHFAEVVTPTIRAAILDPHEQQWSSSRGLMFKDGEVWLGSAPPITVFNTDAWAVLGVPCDNWRLEPAPPWLEGAWTFASIAELGGTLSDEPPTQWDLGTITIPPVPADVELALSARDHRHCRRVRFGSLINPPEGRAPSLGMSGFGTELEGQHFFDVECNIKGPHGNIERIYVQSQTQIAIQADAGFFVFLKPGLSSPKGETGELGSACGSGGAECKPGLVCVAQPFKYQRPEGLCTAPSQLLTCKDPRPGWKRFCSTSTH
jgi:hypothetical protein